MDTEQNIESKRETTTKKSSGLILTGLILAIVAVVLSAIPIINNFAFILAVLGLVFGIVGLFQVKKGTHKGKGKAVTTVILSVVAMIIVLMSQQMYSNAINEASKSFDESAGKMTGEKTDELLKSDVDVKIGMFEAIADEYGYNTTKLPVTITNKNSESKSYTIQIEAVDANGARIIDDTVYANELGSGQTQDFEAFKFVESDKVEALKSAQFKIVKVSQM